MVTALAIEMENRRWMWLDICMGMERATEMKREVEKHRYFFRW